MRVKEFATVVNGATPSSKCPEYYDGNIAWFTPKDLSDQGTKYISIPERYITQQGFDSCSTTMLPAGSILMSSRAPIGLLAISTVPCCTNQGFKSFNIDTQKCDPEYLYYYLKYHIKEIEALGSGTTFKEVSKESVENYDIFLPDIKTQKAIVSVLCDIDSKISNNNAICADLEAMAKLLYDYWFIQFDFPDENGKPYKSSGGKMVWNEELKREIPEGWEVKPLGEYISVIRGISYKPADELKQSSANSVSLLKSNNIQNGTINYEQPVFLPQQLADKNQWLTKGAVFITMSSGSKAHMGKTAIVYKDLPYVFGAFCAKIVIDDSVRGYLSTYFRSDWFRTYIENVTAGTSINNIGNDQLTNILLPFPGSDIQKRFEGYLKPMFARQGELGTETQQLASLRDFLLPMLMNGQVKVC